MLAPTIPDVLPPASVDRLDRAELIAIIRAHEAQRSQWEYRIRVCEEKEQLWKNLMSDMGRILAHTFQDCQNAISEQAEKAADLAEQIKVIARNVEDM